jgi:hypothetical protein
VERGVDIVRVKELLGHSTIRITERYIRANREERKKAVKLLCEKRPKEAEMPANLLYNCDTEGKTEDSGRVISLFPDKMNRQVSEYRSYKPGVTGSNPVPPTILFACKIRHFRFVLLSIRIP